MISFRFCTRSAIRTISCPIQGREKHSILTTPNVPGMTEITVALDHATTINAMPGDTGTISMPDSNGNAVSIPIEREDHLRREDHVVDIPIRDPRSRHRTGGSVPNCPTAADQRRLVADGVRPLFTIRGRGRLERSLKRERKNDRRLKADFRPRRQATADAAARAGNTTSCRHGSRSIASTPSPTTALEKPAAT